MPWMVLLAMGLQTCGRQPDSLQSWPGRGRVTCGVYQARQRPVRLRSSSSGRGGCAQALLRRAPGTRAGQFPVSALGAWRGRAPTAVCHLRSSCPDRIAARTRSAACSHSSRRSAGSGRRSGMLRCSVNGLPVHARLPHRISRAYSVSSSGPRTLRTCDGPEGGLDGPADVPEVALPGGHVPPGCRHVLVEQLGHGDGRVGLASRYGLRQQLAELDLRGPLGLACLAEPDLPARQRVGPGVHLHAPGSAGELLYVSGRYSRHD